MAQRLGPFLAQDGLIQRWRYYVSQAVLQGEKAKAGSIARVPASEIESRIIDALGKIEPRLCSRAPTADDDQAEKSPISTDRGNPASDRRAEIRALFDRVTVGQTMIRIALSENAAGEGEAKTLSLRWTAPSPHRRRDIIQGANGDAGVARPMPPGARVILIDAIRKAQRWLDRLLSDPSETIEAIALREGKTDRSIRMTLSLAFLAPDIVKAAIDGRLPRGRRFVLGWKMLGLERSLGSRLVTGLKRLIDLPMAWPDQWRALGLKAPAQS